MTRRQKTLGWFVFALTMVCLGLIAVVGAVAVGTRPRWPTTYPGSMASRLTADYSAELDALLSMAPLRLDLIRDLLIDEGAEGAPSGPVATLAAALFGTPTPTVPGGTPESSKTPTPDSRLFTRTPTPDASVTPTPTRLYTVTPTPGTGTPSVTPTPVTLRPTLPSGGTDATPVTPSPTPVTPSATPRTPSPPPIITPTDTPKPTDPLLPTSTSPTSPLATPR